MYKNLLILFFFLTPAMFLFGQEKDIEFRLGISLEKKINKKFSLFNEEEVRFNNNVSSFAKAYFEIGTEYKISDLIRLGIAYRLSKINKQEYFGKQQRFTGDITLAKKVNHFKIRFRNRYQTGYDYLPFYDMNIVPERIIRSRLKLSYKIEYSALEPFAYGEIYHQMFPVSNRGFNKYRICAGLSYRLNKSADLNLYYIIEHEINVNNRMTTGIGGINLSWKL